MSPRIGAVTLWVMAQDDALIERLEMYYDAVPRPRSRTEECGPFTLFLATSGWPYYARPRLGQAASATPDDVRQVLRRQQEIGVPQALEWVDEMTPGLAETVESVGVAVARCPLLVLEGTPRGYAGSARMLEPADRDTVVASRAAVSIGFTHGGTATGDEGIAERDAAMKSTFAQVDEALAARVVAGDIRFAGAFVPAEPELGPVGGGSYTPVGGVAEIAGVAVLPAFRRRGLAVQLSHVLAADALGRGVSTVFCSAQSDDVARVYERVGFRRVGTACIAEVNPDHG